MQGGVTPQTPRTLEELLEITYHGDLFVVPTCQSPTFDANFPHAAQPSLMSKTKSLLKLRHRMIEENVSFPDLFNIFRIYGKD